MMTPPNRLNLYGIRDNLVAIVALCENQGVDEDNCRGMCSMVAHTLVQSVDALIKKQEGAE